MGVGLDEIPVLGGRTFIGASGALFILSISLPLFCRFSALHVLSNAIPYRSRSLKCRKQRKIRVGTGRAAIITLTLIALHWRAWGDPTCSER